MGTNYYLSDPPCLTCGRVSDKDDWVHLGKSSGGWTFSFRGSDQVRNYEEWCKQIEDALADRKIIINEYEEPVSFDYLKLIVENKKRNKKLGLSVGKKRI